MKKILSLLCLSCCLFLSSPALADQQTTVLKQEVKIGRAEGSLPYIDGNMEVDFEKMANEAISNRAKEMLKRFGNNGEISYTVTLNRPSVVSILLHANYDGKHVYEGLNLDLTSGKEFGLNDFFVNDDNMQSLFDKNEEVLFEEKGILKRSSKNGPFDKFLPYEEIIPSIRIGEAGRLLQIARLTENADGKELRIKSGSMYAMKLDSNPSTGYSWNLKQSSNIIGNIVKVGSSFVLPNVDDNRVGTPGVEISMYAARSKGTYDVVMEYKRPWETFVQKKISFKLIVE